jgi:uncharacterized protein with NRDE domain
MCLILLAWNVHPDVPLAVAANRDEFHLRPASRAAFWKDRPDILAGRDLQAGGTWMGMSRSGRFAAVTNYRGGTEPGAAESRGSLVTRYLGGTEIPQLAEGKSAFSGFNLLASDGKALWWLSNRDAEARRLPPGWYGLGNLLLDSPDVEPHRSRSSRCSACWHRQRSSTSATARAALRCCCGASRCDSPSAASTPPALSWRR